MRTNRGANIALAVVLAGTGVGWMGSKSEATYLPSGTPGVEMVRAIHVSHRDDHNEAQAILQGCRYNLKNPQERKEFKQHIREHVREHADAGKTYEQKVPELKAIASTIAQDITNMPNMEGKTLDEWGVQMEAWGEQLEENIEKKLEGIEPKKDLQKYKSEIQKQREGYIQEHLKKNGRHEEARERRQYQIQMHLENIESSLLEHYEALKDKESVVIRGDGKIYEIPGPVLYEKLQPLVKGPISQIPEMLSRGFATMPSMEGKTLEQWGEEMGAWGEKFGYEWDTWGAGVEKQAQGLEEWIQQYEVQK